MKSMNNKIVEFKSWYDQNLEFHNEAMLFFCKLISALPKITAVKGRIKSYEECLSKFKRKYVPLINLDDASIKISELLTDIIGIRAVCYYSDEVNQIRRSLRKYFTEVEITDKTHILEKTDDKFGYKSLHMQLLLKNRLRNIPNTGRFRNIIIELQIRTLVQDAWGTLDHVIKYKKSIPQKLKRRINRLSALFEIADDEFLSIKNEIKQEERKINDRLKSGGTIERNKSLDVFRFLFVVIKYFPDYNFIEYKIDGFVQEILHAKSTFTEGELNDSLDKYLKYAEDIEKKENQILNPYTKIRYCLFMFDKTVFSDILSKYQTEVVFNQAIHVNI